MNRRPTLTLAYLELAPRSAAQVLQGLQTDEAAAFLESVPARLSAPVVTSMIPWGAARCLEQLSAPRAAAIVRRLVFQDSTGLLRLVHADRRDPILAELPSRLARRLRNSLQYAPNQVGAWTDPEVPVLRASDTVQDARKFLRESLITASHIFLESDNDGKFAGTISAKDLIDRDADAPLSQLPITRVAPLSNRASLSTLALDPRWDDYLYLPVVGRRSNLLGGLSRSALRKGLHEQRVDADSPARSGLGHLLTAFFLTCAGMLNLAMQAMNVAPTHSKGDDSGGY